MLNSESSLAVKIVSKYLSQFPVDCKRLPLKSVYCWQFKSNEDVDDFLQEINTVNRKKMNTRLILQVMICSFEKKLH